MSVDDVKNSASTDYSDPNGNRVGRPHTKPVPPRPRKKNNLDNSTIDDLPIHRENSSNKNADSPEPIVLPDDPNFTCSVNGRNGWLVDEVYDFGESVRRDTFINTSTVDPHIFSPKSL